jgi:hypothetical protein
MDAGSGLAASAEDTGNSPEGGKASAAIEYRGNCTSARSLTAYPYATTAIIARAAVPTRRRNAPRRRRGGEAVSDSIVKPTWYSRFNPEPLDVLEAWEDILGIDEMSAIQYIVRHDAKNGADDIHKAIFYLNRILKRKYGGAS